MRCQGGPIAIWAPQKTPWMVDFNCHIQSGQNGGGETRQAPQLDDIAGAKHWDIPHQ
jgi:hypothetical protein